MKELRLFRTGIAAVLFVLLSSVFTVNAFAAAPANKAKAVDSYVCTAEKSTGFAYDKEWQIANFNVSTNKYFITKSKRNDFITSEWEVKRIGKNYPTYYCPKDFDKFGYLNCELMGTFTMNNNNLRYLLIFPFGYVSDNIKDEKGNVIIKEGESKPFLEIGKCSPL